MARQIKIRKTRKTARSFSSVLAALMVVGLMVFMATPALAHHDVDHTQGGGNSESVQEADHEASSKAQANSDKDGDADSDPNTAYTEDTDTNDGGTPDGQSDPVNAHPSGKDRSIENGGSGTQGKAESNPDDSKGPQRYEGVRGDDKANGPGGMDLADQDGNNGCGNDDDFDDDNNGHCGKPAAPVAPSNTIKPSNPTPPVVLGDTQSLCPAGTDRAGQPMASLAECDEDDVLGRDDLAEPKDDDDVLGKVLHNAGPAVQAAPAAVKGAVLPFTGGAILGYVFAALGLMAAGIVALKATKN